MIEAKRPQKNPDRVLIGPVRLSYCHLFRPFAPQNGTGEGKYQTAILIPKGETEAVKVIRQAIEEAKQDAKNKKWNGRIPSRLADPLRDGEDKAEKDPVYADHYFLTAKADRANEFIIVDRSKQPIEDEDEVYSGVWAKVSLAFYGYNVNGNCGVAVRLKGVQKIKDGERLSGGSSAVDDFDDESFDNESDDDL